MKYDFKDRLMEIMHERGYTTRTLEEQTGITRRVVCHWKDCRYPTAENLIILAHELDVSTDELLGLSDVGSDTLRRAIEDAKLSGCKTCYYGRDYGTGTAVCVRQDDRAAQYPKKNLACWEWRGHKKNKWKE